MKVYGIHYRTPNGDEHMYGTMSLGEAQQRVKELKENTSRTDVYVVWREITDWERYED